LNSWANWTGSESELVEAATTLPELAICEWKEEVDKLYAKLQKKKRDTCLKQSVVGAMVILGLAAAGVFMSG
jgi:hypothetical protein